jgi:hypothetical protein
MFSYFIHLESIFAQKYFPKVTGSTLEQYEEAIKIRKPVGNLQHFQRVKI